ncbi:hypothetical protein ACNAN0_02505 [Agrilactobacillus fermenti]|uniref:hypothetical protein n=2 Tax=Agrilactobacillus fermenti TaxID=2586909 RepID=UPI003A5BF19E
MPMQNENVPYPFVVVGSLQTVSNATKTSINGQVILTIDCWGNSKMQLTISRMVDRIFHAAIGTIETTNYRFFGKVSAHEKQLLQDTSVPNTVLNRGLLTLRFEIM